MLKTLNALSASGMWPQPFSKSNKNGADADAFISQKLFQEILNYARGNKEEQIRTLGVNFVVPTNRVAGTSRRKENEPLIDLGEPDRWRLTSFRVTPCSKGVFQHNGNDESESNLQPQSPSSKGPCRPQIRVVAQPYLGDTPWESALGWSLPFQTTVGSPDFYRYAENGWYFGDYAIHLFFDVSEEELISAAQKLAKLKLDFSSKCNSTGVPLGIHPCLLRDVQLSRQDKKIEFAPELQKILLGINGNLVKIAFMGSDSNRGPWKMFFGYPSGDSFEPAVIPATLMGSFPAVGKTSLFTENKAMLFTRASAILGDNGSVLIGDAPTVRPLIRPNRDSITLFLSNQLRFRENALGKSSNPNSTRTDNINTLSEQYRNYVAKGKVKLPSRYKFTGDYPRDLLSIVSRIENPKLNNDLSVDCVSCHMARVEGQFVRGTDPHEEKWTPPENISKHAQILWSFGKWMPGHLEYEYIPPSGITASSNAFYQGSHRISRPNARMQEVYVMNQFSIYRSSPIVSQRVTNESAEAASAMNQAYLKVQNPWQNNCFMPALRACLITSWNKDRADRAKWLAQADFNLTTHPTMYDKKCMDNEDICPKNATPNWSDATSWETKVRELREEMLAAEAAPAEAAPAEAAPAEAAPAEAAPE